MSLEGTLKVRVHLAAGRIGSVEIGSTRPDVAQRLLQGRPRADVQAAVPLLFSVCGRSQAICAALAAGAAAGEPASALTLAQARRGVAAEMLREVAWLSLLQWPQRLGETATAAAVAAARQSLTTPIPPQQAAQPIALAAFGLPAEQWLAIDSLDDLQAWAQSGLTAPARFIAQALQRPCATAPSGPPHAWLPAPLTPEHAAELALALDADPDFARQPHWRGSPAEAGALARHRHHPLLRALLAYEPAGVAARLVARLHELARLLLDEHSVCLGALELRPGLGLAWVENARGLLLHRVQLCEARQQVHGYRIVAPTEWNFRPGGPLATALAGAPVSDAAAAESLAMRLIHSLDPCVACHVETAHA